jgi:hypothetical protein
MNERDRQDKIDNNLLGVFDGRTSDLEKVGVVSPDGEVWTGSVDQVPCRALLELEHLVWEVELLADVARDVGNSVCELGDQLVANVVEHARARGRDPGNLHNLVELKSKGKTTTGFGFRKDRFSAQFFAKSAQKKQGFQST